MTISLMFEDIFTKKSIYKNKNWEVGMEKEKWNLWNKDWKMFIFFRIEKYLKPYKFVGSFYTYFVLEIYIAF